MKRHRAPKIVVFDPVDWFEEWDYDFEKRALAEQGVEFVVPADRRQRDTSYADADVVVLSGYEVFTARHIARLRRCVGILCYSAGMDQVDSDAAARAGITVRNIRPATVDVADHAIALLLVARRLIVQMANATANGSWDLANHPEFREIRRVSGTVLGIVGAGAIGRAIAARARGFDMTTIATYRHPPDETDPLLPHMPLNELFATADAVILAAALTEESRGMIDMGVLSHSKPGMVLVNIARGGLLVEDDLVHALDTGLVRMAALDVRHPEPPEPGRDRLTGRSDVIQTPHMGGMSVEAFADVHRLAVSTMLDLLRDGERL